MTTSGRTTWLAATLGAAALFGAFGAFGGDGDGGGGTKPPERRASSVDDLIRDLASDDFKTREAATEALGARGAEAIPALEKAAKDKDPEVRWRAEKALKAAREKAAQKSEPALPQDGERSHEKTTPDPTEPAPDPARERLRELEDELSRMRPEIGELLKGMRLQDALPKEFGKILEEMEERLRDLDRPLPERPPVRDFWTFRYKDGQWQVERSDDPIAEKVGVRTQPIPPVARAQLVLSDPSGLAIEEVKPGSLAARAGLMRYDLLLVVDGKPVETERDLEILAREGDHQVEIMRAGSRQTVAVHTGAPPAPEKPAELPKKKEGGELRKY